MEVLKIDSDFQKNLKRLRYILNPKRNSFIEIKRNIFEYKLIIKFNSFKNEYSLEEESIIKKYKKNLFWKIKVKKESLKHQSKKFKSYSALIEYIVKSFIE